MDEKKQPYTFKEKSRTVALSGLTSNNFHAMQ